TLTHRLSPSLENPRGSRHRRPRWNVAALCPAAPEFSSRPCTVDTVFGGRLRAAAPRRLPVVYPRHASTDPVSDTPTHEFPLIPSSARRGKNWRGAPAEARGGALRVGALSRGKERKPREACGCACRRKKHNKNLKTAKHQTAGPNPPLLCFPSHPPPSLLLCVSLPESLACLRPCPRLVSPWTASSAPPPQHPRERGQLSRRRSESGSGSGGEAGGSAAAASAATPEI
ncbi:hypothetical protein U9M48_006983, partial [Paspalum notatum var. saurae]